ncbi:NAD(P)-dependent oxidoreductase [bacterium]|jgi:UDP-glucose 4-epimerase|nr:NAD(P)-dependent oxidoreductase [bacterium]
MKKAVVFGGAGFVGSHVADYLSDADYQVTIYDKKKSHWLRADQEMVVGDIKDKEEVSQAIVGTDVVYNFAALADINKALKKPAETVSINILGNINVIEACHTHGVKRFVYASTVYVHSREGGFYRCSKQASESYVEEYQRLYGLNYTILRYGSLYGPRADNSNGLYRVVKSALNEGVVKYAGNINSMREYIHVEDAAKASVDILSDEFKNENIVLTGQEPMRVSEMLNMLAEILGLNKKSIKFTEDSYEGHYIRTPYAYQPKLGKKYIPPVHVDLGQGLLQIIDEISRQH